MARHHQEVYRRFCAGGRRSIVTGLIDVGGRPGETGFWSEREATIGCQYEGSHSTYGCRLRRDGLCVALRIRVVDLCGAAHGNPFLRCVEVIRGKSRIGIAWGDDRYFLESGITKGGAAVIANSVRISGDTTEGRRRVEGDLTSCRVDSGGPFCRQRCGHDGHGSGVQALADQDSTVVGQCFQYDVHVHGRNSHIRVRDGRNRAERIHYRDGKGFGKAVGHGVPGCANGHIIYINTWVRAHKRVAAVCIHGQYTACRVPRARGGRGTIYGTGGYGIVRDDRPGHGYVDQGGVDIRRRIKGIHQDVEGCIMTGYRAAVVAGLVGVRGRALEAWYGRKGEATIGTEHESANTGFGRVLCSHRLGVPLGIAVVGLDGTAYGHTTIGISIIIRCLSGVGVTRFNYGDFLEGRIAKRRRGTEIADAVDIGRHAHKSRCRVKGDIARRGINGWVSCRRVMVED